MVMGVVDFHFGDEMFNIFKQNFLTTLRAAQIESAFCFTSLKCKSGHSGPK